LVTRKLYVNKIIMITAFFSVNVVKNVKMLNQCCCCVVCLKRKKKKNDARKVINKVIMITTVLIYFMDFKCGCKWRLISLHY
jgi:hypothetical protein